MQPLCLLAFFLGVCLSTLRCSHRESRAIPNAAEQTAKTAMAACCRRLGSDADSRRLRQSHLSYLAQCLPHPEQESPPTIVHVPERVAKALYH